jgi:hypothetical protein
MSYAPSINLMTAAAIYKNEDMICPIPGAKTKSANLDNPVSKLYTSLI